MKTTDTDLALIAILIRIVQDISNRTNVLTVNCLYSNFGFDKSNPYRVREPDPYKIPREDKVYLVPTRIATGKSLLQLSKVECKRNTPLPLRSLRTLREK